MQLRTSGIHCRESGTGPVVLKAVPGTGAAFSGSTMGRFFVCLSFSTPTNGTEVGSRCETGHSPRVGARTPPLQHLLCGVYKRGLHAFQGGERLHGRSGVPQEESGGGGGRGGATDGEPSLTILM